jgi:uncharacterized protein (TIGR02302 family)
MTQHAPRLTVDRLGAYRMAALAVLTWESGLAAAWPVLAVCAGLAAAALVGIPALLPPWLHLALVLAALATLGGLAWRAARHFRLPAPADAERRLELDSGLRHRPFATLRDVPAAGTPAQDALWRAHQARARVALARLRLSPPNAEITARDPFALRAAASLLLAAGLVIAGPQAGTRLLAALLPGIGGLMTGAGPVIQAWIQPPAYTGLAPVFLPHGGGTVSVPLGSRLTVSMTGASGAPSISMAGTKLPAQKLAQDSFQSVTTLTQPGLLGVSEGFLASLFATPQSWTVSLIPNEPPVAAWPKLPGRAGTSLSTSLPWQVSQRWGVAALEAEMRPKDRPDLPALRVPIPLPGMPKQADGSLIRDLAANPYAGVTMTARLDARDVSGQHGQSPPADFVLPARIFHHPLARAIADLRRRLALHPDEIAEQAAELRALTEAPPTPAVRGLSTAGIILNLATAAARLDDKPGDAEIAAVQGQLWTLALALDGALPDPAAAALDEARDNLRRGLDEHLQGKLSKRDLDQKLQALREALDKRLQEMARQAMKQGALQHFDPKTQHLSSRAIDRALQRLERALEEGRTQDARQAMADLNRMMDELKNAHIMSPEEAQQAEAQAKKGRQQRGAVDDMIQRETTLLDHAQARAPNSFANRPSAPPLPGFGLFPQPLPPPGTAPQDSPAPQDHQAGPPEAQPAPSQLTDARTQRALHRALDALRQGLSPLQAARPGQRPAPPGGPDGAAPDPTKSGSAQALDDAGHAMDDAANGLARLDDPPARDAIARAIAALQRGGQAMSREQQQGEGSGAGMALSLEPGGQGARAGRGEAGEDGDEGEGDSESRLHKDPFGRHVDGNGTAADDSDLNVPDKMEEGRSRAIQDELRRRGADRGRPKSELDYIERLLKPF